MHSVCVYVCQLMIAGGYEYAGEGVRLHRTENPFYEFPEKELRGHSPNSYIHVSASDFYIPRIGPHTWLQQSRQPDPGNI